MSHTTYWWCSRCNTDGSVAMGEHVDVWTGLEAVWANHHATTPDCEEVYYIRVSVGKPVPVEMRVPPVLSDS